MFYRKKFITFFICLLMVNFFVLESMAASRKDYNAWELKELIDSGAPVFLLNPLSELEFNEGHIPGSINIPTEEIMKTPKLPRNKDALIITYCKGPK